MAIDSNTGGAGKTAMALKVAAEMVAIAEGAAERGRPVDIVKRHYEHALKLKYIAIRGLEQERDFWRFKAQNTSRIIALSRDNQALRAELEAAGKTIAALDPSLGF